MDVSPAKQLTHELAPATEDVPAKQFVHALAPARDHWPGKH